MKKMTLAEYLEGKTMAQVGKDIGVTEGAVWQMKRSSRHITITVHDDGQVEAHEIKPIGRTKLAA